MSQTMTGMVESRYFQVEEVADGVFAAIVQEGQGALGNAGIVDLGDATLIFDTFCTPGAGLDLRRAAEALLPHPVRYVVNSHQHFDHVFGNQVFEEAVVVATEKTRELMEAELQVGDIAEETVVWEQHLQELREEADRQTDEAVRHALLNEAAEKQQILQALPEIRLTLPQVTFRETIQFHGTKRSVTVISMGGGHSQSDSVLLLPDANVLFAGDLVFVDTHPSIHQQPTSAWLAILEHLAMLDFETVVPGHGPVGKKAQLGVMKQYLTDITKTAHEANVQEMSMAHLVQLMPEAYRKWAWPHMYAWNLQNIKAMKPE